MIAFLQQCSPSMPYTYIKDLVSFIRSDQCIFQDVAHYISINKTSYIHYAPSDLITMICSNNTPKQEVCTQKSDTAVYNRLIGLDVTKDIVGGDIFNTKSAFVCKMCRKGGVSWQVKQTKSADEGSTIFCVCPHCFNRWKM